MTSGGVPDFVVDLVQQLRRRQFPLGLDDLDLFRTALAAGFGWRSSEDLREVCVSLWATSPAEAAVIRAAFSRVTVPVWTLTLWADQQLRPAVPPEPAAADDSAQKTGASADEPISEGSSSSAPTLQAYSGLGEEPPPVASIDRSLVLVPQYPLTERDMAQTWRRLRRPQRSGPPVELDVAATVEQRSRTTVPTPPVLVPRQRNIARLLLLLDRSGSMTPFHRYVDQLVQTICRSARLDDTVVAYFHDVPGQADRGILDQLPDPFSPQLDAVLPLIEPLTGARVYSDPELTEPQEMADLLDRLQHPTSVLVVSDAGAARQSFDVGRLLDSLALVRSVLTRGDAIAWVNPIPEAQWPRTTAGQLARHTPMYPLTRSGLDEAVETLRGRPAILEHAL